MQACSYTRQCRLIGTNFSHFHLDSNWTQDFGPSVAMALVLGVSLGTLQRTCCAAEANTCCCQNFDPVCLLGPFSSERRSGPPRWRLLGCSFLPRGFLSSAILWQEKCFPTFFKSVSSLPQAVDSPPSPASCLLQVVELPWRWIGTPALWWRDKARRKCWFDNGLNISLKVKGLCWCTNTGGFRNLNYPSLRGIFVNL